MSAAINIYSTYQTKPTENLWKSPKRILGSLKGIVNFDLYFPKHNITKLIGYTDTLTG